MKARSEAMPVVLVVDDLPENSQLLSEFLVHLGYGVEIANSGAEALAAVAARPPDALLLDLVMPGIDGFEVCQRLKNSPITQHIPIIVVTGMNDRDSNLRAVEAGADDFLTKPFDTALLGARLKRCLRTKDLHDLLVTHQEELEDRVRQRTQALEHAQQVTVLSLAKLSESRDSETGDHLERIRRYAREVSLELLERGACPGELNQDFVQEIYYSSPLHDIGKVGIRDDILLKPGRLTRDEFEEMKVHTLIGGDTLRSADLEAGQASFLVMGRDIAYFHHERWDGEGYPFGLQEDEIPLSARIVAIADVYDALTSKRPYKLPYSHGASVRIVTQGRGEHFDPLVTDAFLAREEAMRRIRLSPHKADSPQSAPYRRAVAARN